MTGSGLCAARSIEHFDQAVLAWREEVASDEYGSLSLRQVVEVGDPDVRWLKKGVTGLQGHDRAIGYLESDHASDHPADDGTWVQVKAGRLGRSEFDARHLEAVDHRLGLEGRLQQRLAHNR